MKDYFKAFASLENELKKNPFIEVQKFTFDEGLSDFYLKNSEDEYGVKMPAEVKDFYRSISFVNFLWVLKEDAGIPLMPHDEPGNVNGKINILDLSTVIGGNEDDADEPWKNVLWFEDVSVNDERIRDLRPFDFFDNHNGECAGFLKTALDKGDTSLYLRDDQGSIGLFEMNIEQYVDYVLKCKGFVGCQQAFAYNTSEDADRMNYYLPKIFGT